MVVVHIEPLLLPILIGVNQLIRQVLVGGIFAHLDAYTTDYLRVICTQFWLHLEELPEQYLVRLDPQECLPEMNKDGGVEYTIRVQVDLLDLVVLE
jgi:hypothetical protein